MAFVTYSRELRQNLQDLGNYGIHLNNQVGVCHRCGKAIDKRWSSGHCLDAMCEPCYYKECQNSAPYRAYNALTVHARKVLNQQNAQEQFDAFIKIDGRLIYARHYIGVTYQLLDADTGEVIIDLGLKQLQPQIIESLYKQQKGTTVQAYVVQLNWYRIKEAVSIEIFHHLNWADGGIPLYNLGHVGRGWETGGSVNVRLYLRLNRPYGNRDDFDLLAAQLVKEADAPFLDGFEATKFPGDVINLKWNQAGPALLQAFLSIKADSEINPEQHPLAATRRQDGDTRTMMERKMDDLRAFYHSMAARYAMPTDAWITLIVSDDRHEFNRGAGIRHQLDHVLVHPF